MPALSKGYRVAGGLSVAYAILMGAFWSFFVAAEGWPAPQGGLDWLVVAVLALTPLSLLLGGGLLLARSPSAWRAAGPVLLASAAMLFVKAAAVTAATVQELRHPTSSTGALVALNIPLMIMPASIWGVVAGAVGLRLSRRPHEAP